jgi:hypothetical protein
MVRYALDRGREMTVTASRIRPAGAAILRSPPASVRSKRCSPTKSREGVYGLSPGFAGEGGGRGRAAPALPREPAADRGESET